MNLNARAAGLEAELEAEAGIGVEGLRESLTELVDTLGAQRWDSGLRAGTIQEMQRRACIATSNLPDYTDADFAEVADRFVRAAQKMKAGGFWWHDGVLTNKNIKRQILKEMLAKRFGR